MKFNFLRFYEGEPSGGAPSQSPVVPVAPALAPAPAVQPDQASIVDPFEALGYDIKKIAQSDMLTPEQKAEFADGLPPYARKLYAESAPAEIAPDQPRHAPDAPIAPPLDDPNDFQKVFKSKAYEFLGITDTEETQSQQAPQQSQGPVDLNQIFQQYGSQGVQKVIEALQSVASEKPKTAPVQAEAPAQDKQQMVFRRGVEIATEQGWAFGDPVRAFLDDNGNRVNATPEVLLSYALQGRPVVIQKQNQTPEEAREHDLRVQQYVKNARLAVQVAKPEVELEFIQSQQEKARAESQRKRQTTEEVHQVIYGVQNAVAFADKVDPLVKEKMENWLRHSDRNYIEFQHDYVLPHIKNVRKECEAAGRKINENDVKTAGVLAFRDFYERHSVLLTGSPKKDIDNTLLNSATVAQKVEVARPLPPAVPSVSADRLPLPSVPPSVSEFPSERKQQLSGIEKHKQRLAEIKANARANFKPEYRKV